MKSILASILVLAMSGLSAKAQIVITMDDDRPILESTRCTVYSASDVSGKTISLGGSGAGKIFDLTGYSFISSQDVGPGAKLGSFGPPFSQATHRADRTYGNYPIWFFIGNFYVLNSTGRYYLGKHHEWPELALNNNYVWTPPGVDYPFPCALGTEWSDDVDVNILDYSTGNKTGSQTSWRNAKVEASGLLRLPMGDFECLRIKRKEHTEFGRYTRHEFVTKTNIRVVVTIDTLDEESDTPRMQSVVITEYQPPTEVRGGIEFPEDIALYPNHPNPFAHSTNIRYSLPREAFVTVNMYNALGQNIDMITIGMEQAGVHSFQWQANDQAGHRQRPGVYLCQFIAITTSGVLHQKTIRMVVLH